jgi:diadenosine tetraphosphate (Ap4A) HIT family hydrolase
VSTRPCPFCARIAHARHVALGDTIEKGEVVAENEHALAFRDEQPVSRGHTLVVPRRCEPDLLALGLEERSAVWELASLVAQELRVTLLADGVNIGVNVGEAAGQTVHHAHVHVIPRYMGDVEDPRGGVCRVVPKKANPRAS